MNDQPKINAGFKLIEETGEAALATLDENGFPFASLTSFARHADGRLLMLLSNLARHTANLNRDNRASLLIADTQGPDAQGPEGLARSRGTFVGRVEKLTDAAEIAAAKATFVARHPSSATYADFPDFNVYALTIDTVHMVQGFGRIFEIKGEDLR
ncbi:MAG: pyridoxamine 5'-phosphate oxidase family protein [Parvibaculum sp.]|nr:pyridoxamine 5'-phosphate oxidase family protein [Parvibaculum sp.]